MDAEKVNELIKAYNEKIDRVDSDNKLSAIGEQLNEKLVVNYVSFSIINNLQPEIVLRAIAEASLEASFTNEAIVTTIKCLINGKFANEERAESTTTVLRKIAPNVCSTRICYRLMKKLWKAANSKSEEKLFIAGELLSIIPPLYNKIYKDNSMIKEGEEELPSREVCENWLEEVFTYKINSFLTPALIDMLSDLPLTTDNLSSMVDFILKSVTFKELPQITEKIFQPLCKNKKLTTYCLKKILLASLSIEKSGIDKQSQKIQCELIKKLSFVATTNRTVLDAITQILSSKTELPHHFTPFIVSLSLYLSKMRPKINESLFSSFDQQLKDDQMRTNSKLLRHIYNLFSEQLSELALESVVRETVELTYGLESNIRFLVEFAFILVDKAQPENIFKRQRSSIKESNSEFVSPSYRQIDIGTRIISQCAKKFQHEEPEIFSQIVQRLITKMPNSESLIKCLNSDENPALAAESLVEVIEQMQHLELQTLELVMKIAIPKIIDDISLIDRVVLAAKKAFCNRSEASKLNGIAAMFYLIQPRAEKTFTQTLKQHIQFGSRVSSIASEDMQFEIYRLIQRGFTQTSAVQADSYMFIPLLLQQNSQLSNDTASSFIDQLTEVVIEEEFPLKVARSTPYLLQSVSDSLNSLPESILEEEEWIKIAKMIDDIAISLSKIDIIVYTEEMKIFVHPEERDIILAIHAVLFNHMVVKDKTVALDIFNTYDRILHKTAESEKLRKDNVLKGTFNFKFSINMDLILKLLEILRGDDDDYTKNYGIQLYTLERISAVINEVPNLRVEYRMRRLQLAMQLGKISVEAIDNVKWCDPPSGMKNAQSLVEILTNCFKKIFTFVFETYDRETVELFLISSNLMTRDQSVLNAENNLFKSVKYFLANSQSKCVDNFCFILEKLSLLDQSDSKFFAKIIKVMNKLIQNNKSQSCRLIRLARCFSPAAGLDWLKDAATIIVDRLADEESSTSAALHELIQTISQITTEIDWAVTNWISKVDAEDNDKGAEINSSICEYMLDIAKIGALLMDVDYTRFQIKYYEDIIKFIIEYLKVTIKLMKKTDEIPNSNNDGLSETIRFATSEFGDKVSKFTIKCQATKDGDKSSRQNDFDAKMAPKLIFNLEKLLVDASNLIDKKILDPDIKDTFCKIRGTDVKMNSRAKKKEKVEEIEPEQEPEDEPEEVDVTEDQDNGGEEEVDEGNRTGQYDEEEEDENDSVEEIDL